MPSPPLTPKAPNRPVSHREISLLEWIKKNRLLLTILAIPCAYALGKYVGEKDESGTNATNKPVAEETMRKGLVTAHEFDKRPEEYVDTSKCRKLVFEIPQDCEQPVCQPPSEDKIREILADIDGERWADELCAGLCIENPDDREAVRGMYGKGFRKLKKFSIQTTEITKKTYGYLLLEDQEGNLDSVLLAGPFDPNCTRAIGLTEYEKERLKEEEQKKQIEEGKYSEILEQKIASLFDTIPLREKGRVKQFLDEKHKNLLAMADGNVDGRTRQTMACRFIGQLLQEMEKIKYNDDNKDERDLQKKMQEVEGEIEELLKQLVALDAIDDCLLILSAKTACSAME